MALMQYDGALPPFPVGEVERVAASYPPEAAGVPRWERERYFTATQLAAWEQRFARHD
jgi:hypothetical protein